MEKLTSSQHSAQMLRRETWEPGPAMQRDQRKRVVNILGMWLKKQTCSSIMAQQEVMVRRRNRQTQSWRRAVEGGTRHGDTFLFAGMWGAGPGKVGTLFWNRSRHRHLKTKGMKKMEADFLPQRICFLNRHLVLRKVINREPKASKTTRMPLPNLWDRSEA